LLGTLTNNTINNVVIRNINQRLLYHPQLYYNNLININLTFLFIIYIGETHDIAHKVILFFVKYLPIKYNLMSKNLLYFLPPANIVHGKYSGKLLKKRNLKLPKVFKNFKFLGSFYKYFIKFFIF